MDRLSRPVNAQPARHEAGGDAAAARPGGPGRGHPRRSASPPRAALVALALALPLGACSLFAPPVIDRGNRVTQDQLNDITVGVHSRADVQAMLGSPTTSSTFGDPSWYYIAARSRIRPARYQAITDQETVAVDFDSRGIVQRVRVLTESDMRPVEMVSRETPTPGNERTLLQALFGNIGRFGSAGLMAEQQGPGAPAPTSTR
jgi:outer membrane protein assembly factor BamE (lipoprotein component of BamABCDE complex)